MDAQLYIIFGILVLLILLAVVAIMRYRKHPVPPDYYSFFVMGIIWLGAGSALMAANGVSGSGLFFMGLIFTIVGFANKKKWKANRRRLEHLSLKEKKFRVIMIAIMTGILVLGIVTLLLVRSGIF